MSRPPRTRHPFLARALVRALSYRLHLLHRFALRRPRRLLLLAGLVVLGLAPQVGSTRVHLSIRDIVDADLPSTERLDAMEREFGGGNSALVLFRPAGGGRTLSPLEIARIQDWLGTQSRENRHLLRIEFPPAPEDAPGPEEDVTVGRRDLAAELVFADTPGGSRYGKFDPAPIGHLRRSLDETLLPNLPGIEAHVVGDAPFVYDSLQGIRWFRKLNVLVLVLLLCQLRATLGTWRSGGCLVFVLGLAGIAVYGTMGLVGAPIDLLSTGLFLLLAVAAIEDFYFLSQQQEGGRSWRRAYRRVLVPSFFTSLTTVIGFGSLALSEMEMVRRFGTFAAFGAVVEWVATFLLLPAFLQITTRRTTWVSPRPALVFRRLGRWTRMRMARPVALALLLVHAGALWAAAHLNFSDSPIAVFPRSHAYRAGIEALGEAEGWKGQFYLVFEPSMDPGAAEGVLSALRKHPDVATVLSPDRGSAVSAAGGEGGRLRASIHTRDVDLDTVGRVREHIDELCRDGGCYPAGPLISYADFASRVPEVLLRSLLTCLVLVGLVLLGLTRARRQPCGLAIVASAFWAPSVMLIALALLRVPVNFLTCVFASVLVGLTGDNVIQFLFASKTGPISEGVEDRSAAAIQVAIVTAVCALIFLGSSFVPSRRLGMLLAAGVLASLVGDIWILRALTPAGTERHSVKKVDP